MNRVFLASITTKMQERGHRIEWLIEGENIRHGRCTACSKGVVLEGQGGFHHARGDALEHACTTQAPTASRPLVRLSTTYAL